MIAAMMMNAIACIGIANELLPPLVTPSTFPPLLVLSQSASTAMGFHTGDSQKPTHTQPFAPTQYCDGFSLPSLDTLKTPNRHSEQTASLVSQYELLVDGK